MCLNKEGILSESTTDIHDAGCMPTLQHLTYNVFSAILKIRKKSTLALSTARSDLCCLLITLQTVWILSISYMQ